MQRFFTYYLVICSVLFFAATVQAAEAVADGEESLIDMSDLSWEDTENEADANKQEVAEQKAIQAEAAKQNSGFEESFLGHTIGFGFCLVYFVGGGVFIYHSRKHWMYKKLSPELLVVLHTFWPLQLLLFLFFALPKFAPKNP